MDTTTILDTLADIGVSVRVKGDRLQMNPGGLIPPTLMEEVKAHRDDLVLHLSQTNSEQHQEAASTIPSSWVNQRLQKALKQKREELALRERNLTSPYLEDDSWTRKQITYLQGHIAGIERYLSEGGELKLPQCCKQSHICLIAMRGFDACLMSPDGCGFNLKLT